jgi:putative aldouronate transport system permease protein
MIFLVVIHIVLSLVLVAILYPLIFIVSSSFSATDAVTSGQVWLWPVRPTLDGYKAVFSHQGVLTGYANSGFYAVVGSAISIALTIMVAYPLSRKDFQGRGIITFIFVFTMFFNGGLIPTYLVVKATGMINTRWALLIPSAIGVWFVIITRTFFQSNIPKELTEVAEIDGCSDLYFVWKIVLPLSKPIIAVLALMYAVGKWNAYFEAMIYLNNEDLYPLQIILRQILILNQNLTTGFRRLRTDQLMQRQGMADLLKYALIIVASAPLLILYPFIQKYFIKGVLIGSLKG